MSFGYTQAKVLIAEAGLPGATKLDLSYRSLKYMPESIAKLKHIKSLDLRGNSLKDYSFFAYLTSLENLDLGSNHINDLSFIACLTRLETLDLSSSAISDLRFLKELTGLKSLNIEANNLKDVSVLSDLKGLIKLDVSANKIADYGFFANLTSLQSLSINSNKLTDINFLAHLTNLKSLDLRGNPITDYKVVSRFKSLKNLSLGYYRIPSITFLAELPNLKWLDLRNGSLVDIKPLAKVTGLETLHLGGNEITDVSPLEYLPFLQKLDLSGNKITDISPLYTIIKKGLDIDLDYNSKGIILKGNHLTTPPIKIIEEGREAVLNWFDQLGNQGSVPLYEAKLMILGQGGAGKTTFARLQVDSQYDIAKEQPESTLGIEVHKQVSFDHQSDSCKGVKINTRLWDFGGQNIQKMLHQFFITQDCLYVLVHDKRKENTDFDYWFQIIDLLGPKSPVIVLENQKEAKGNNEAFALAKYQDLFKELDIDRKEVNLGLTRSNHKSRWKKLNALIEEKLSDLEIVNQKVPAKWSNVRSLLTHKKDEKYLRIDEFYKLCANEPIGLTEEQAHLCLTYLKALGDVVYFEDRELGTHIFLDHNWLTEGVYFILSDTKIEKNRGMFTRQQAYAKWNSEAYSVEAKSKLLGLMLKNQFDLCYEIDSDVFITPLLLPIDRPRSAKPIEANLHFRFQYGFMPHGLFSRAIVRLHEKIDGEKRWKSGVLLVDEKTGARAEVQQYNDPKENQQVIDVKIKGKPVASKGMLDFVRRSIEPLHKEFNNLRVVQKVGCNCPVCQGRMAAGENPSFYDYKELLAKIEHRRYFVDCPNDGYEPVNIGQILSEVVTEDAGEKSLDNELLYRLKDMGMSINQIINNNQANPIFNNDPHIENKPVITTTISVEVKVEVGELLDQISALKDDLSNELVAEGVPEKEVQKLVNNVELAEQALEEIEESEQAPKRQAKSRIKRLFDDLQDEKSPLRNGLAKLRKGRDYGVKLAESYNKVATKFGLNPIPGIALDVIKAI